MERLTRRRADTGEPCICTIEGLNRAVERLAAYEDIGADPEEISVQLEILRRYSEAAYGIGLKRLRELAKAEKDGRLMVLPCKLGDVVYLLPASRNDGIRSVKVKRIEMTITRMERDLVLCIDLGDGRQETFRWASDKGRTWFSSKKEAEAALKKETEA